MKSARYPRIVWCGAKDCVKQLHDGDWHSDGNSIFTWKRCWDNRTTKAHLFSSGEVHAARMIKDGIPGVNRA